MKSLEKIYGELLADFQTRTGLEVSSDGDLAVRFYAVAAQLHALYLQAAWTADQCFPQTAAGEYLDLHAALRGVSRKEAARAEGILRFSTEQAGNADRTIPAGTVCMTAGLVRFETTQEGVLEAGETVVEVPARAVEPGTAGNAAAGTILTMSVAPAGIAACTNPAPFSGGEDDESDEHLRVRVLETYRRLANGANAAFYEQQAMAFEEVAAAVVLPRNRGRGTVDVVIATQAGVPGAELVERVQERLDSIREIAVDVLVSAPVTQTVDVSFQIQAAENRDGAAVREQVRQAVLDWFNGQRLGKPVLRAQLGGLIYAVDGVENYTIEAPAADVELDGNELPVLGELTVEAMDA